LNRIEPGYNYGWRVSYPCDDPNPNPAYNTIPPLWYLPTAQCCVAPTGVVVYTGQQIPQWHNELFMAAANTSTLRHFYLTPDRHGVITTNVVLGASPTVDLENGPDGALWYFEWAGPTTGFLRRLVGPGGGTPTATPSPGGPTSTPGGPTSTPALNP